MLLSDEQIDRYSRQIILPEVGGRGQQRLLAAHVAVAGAAAGVEWAAVYLAAAGVGRLTVAGGRDLAARLGDLNADVRVIAAAGDGALAPDVAVLAAAGGEALAGLGRVPLVAFGAGGVTVARPDDAGSPCAACAVDLAGGADLPPTAVAAAATVACTEALKLVLGIGVSLAGRLWRLDGTELAVACRPPCPRSVA